MVSLQVATTVWTINAVCITSTHPDCSYHSVTGIMGESLTISLVPRPSSLMYHTGGREEEKEEK